MEPITSELLISLIGNQKRKTESILPELIKKLIICGCSDITKLRIPDSDDIWAPGFDGVVSIAEGNTYVAAGTSVWEFGTSSDSLGKINSDYEKRTSNPLGIIAETYHIIFSRSWQQPGRAAMPPVPLLQFAKKTNTIKAA